MNKDDPLQQWLMYFNVNNLYGYTMSEKLPSGKFKSVEYFEKLDTEIGQETYEDRQTGYVLSVI
jgi:hypothetical protein